MTDPAKTNEYLLAHLRVKLQYDFPDIRVQDLMVSKLKKQQNIVIDLKQLVPLKTEAQKELETNLLNRMIEVFRGFSIYRSQFTPTGIKIVLTKKIFEELV